MSTFTGGAMESKIQTVFPLLASYLAGRQGGESWVGDVLVTSVLVAQREEDLSSIC